jgi:hypothetical protein
MNRLQSWERAQIIRCLVEGNSIRSTVRITGYAKNNRHEAAGRHR